MGFLRRIFGGGGSEGDDAATTGVDGRTRSTVMPVGGGSTAIASSSNAPVSTSVMTGSR